METKLCQHCQNEQPLSCFFKDCNFCKPCYRVKYGDNRTLRQRAYRAKNLEKTRAASLAYARKNREDINAKVRLKRRLIKQFVLEQLGKKCACCDLDNPEFLTVDHIGPRGIGTRHRRAKGSGALGVYRDIIKQGCPKDQYRILCFNCNSATGLYGYCPHKEMRTWP